MYQIILIPRSDNPNLPAITLSFKGNEKAQKAFTYFQQHMAGEKGVIHYADDYGYISTIRREDILHVLYIDVELAEVQRLEKNLALARVSEKLMARVTADSNESRLLQSIMKAPPVNGTGMPSSPSRIIQ